MDLPRLRRLLGTPELAWLLDRVRRRLEDGRPLDGTVTLTGATDHQRAAVARLLGRPARPGRSLSVPLPAVDTVLRAGGASPDGLAAAVTALTGPVTVRRAQEAATAAAWQLALAELDRPAITDRPELAAWHAGLSTSGLLKRLSGSDPATARRLAADTARVLCHLPADGLTLPVLAARTLGDAHALDHGRPPAALVLSAVRALAPGTDFPNGAEGRRAAWASVGVALDELSSRVLVLNLPALPTGPTGRLLASAREDGEPYLLTLRQLTRLPPEFTHDGRTVHVCENPAILAVAADVYGPDCPPMVCVEGNPSVAARLLLTALATAGCPLVYHGDFDWGGIRIATAVLRLSGATPWRYDTPSYLAAVRNGHGTPLTTGVPAPTPWDPSLSPTLAEHGLRVEEERLLGCLLADLRRSGTTGTS
ncbi:TIGR02679 family protein [Kitasatospora sp. YST-16]|uniref:TIGR02679 family protein n=1 Tax=Kitasatospora sp. YST-16 TaxID=2998080 RepID=UPI0022853892|nr:TIGR02679 family protein [Kitasatospora sp. YST-16]WAL70688.1 TIGR02679 family protein [Kitasatospora sp. YST-16]WNW36731.1 TIGR02679 family protein [Streptomyces sp. Li-HN-5-13]